MHLHIVISEHDHPTIEKQEMEPGDEYEYVTIHLSETQSMSGPADVVLNWVDELHARSLLIRGEG